MLALSELGFRARRLRLKTRAGAPACMFPERMARARPSRAPPESCFAAASSFAGDPVREPFDPCFEPAELPESSRRAATGRRWKPPPRCLLQLRRCIAQALRDSEFARGRRLGAGSSWMPNMVLSWMRVSLMPKDAIVLRRGFGYRSTF